MERGAFNLKQATYYLGYEDTRTFRKLGIRSYIDDLGKEMWSRKRLDAYIDERERITERKRQGVA